MTLKPAALPLAIALALTTLTAAAEGELNLYSARHYQTDEALYQNFTAQTGITINRIEAKDDELIERIRTEGAASPADVLITVDATRLKKADDLGLFAPLESATIAERVPDYLRAPNWAAFSTRARVIFINPELIDRALVKRYEDLARPELKGKLCTRSGSHPYNLSLGAAMIAHHGEAETTKWAEGVVANFARAPKGGDTDQIRAVAAGECAVAIGNSYYFARLMNSDKDADQAVVKAVELVWPNQDSTGTHINVSGAGVLAHAPNRENAVRFLEYLASDEAQQYFANGNNEWPTVPSVKIDNPALAKLGEFKVDEVSIAAVADNVPAAQKVFDRAGFR